MAEKLKHHQEYGHSHELHHEKTEKAAEHAHTHEHRDKLHQIRETAQHEALSADRLAHEADDTASHTGHHGFVNNELKTMAYQRTINRVRLGLSAPSRAFSRVIHQPIVEAISEAAATTVGRPSGILGGGLIALVGTTAYYYITKHYGYDYNFFIFLALLGGGFVAGWVVEFILRAMRGSK